MKILLVGYRVKRPGFPPDTSDFSLMGTINVDSVSVIADGIITIRGNGIGTGTQPTVTLTPILVDSTGVVIWECLGSPKNLMPAHCR